MPPATAARRDPIVVCGLPGSGASEVRRLLVSDQRVTPSEHRFDELDLQSMEFESRWHVPAYAEWLQGFDPETHLRWVDHALCAMGDVRPSVIGSWIDVERLDAIRTVWPNATIVAVTVDPVAAADAAIAVCRAEREQSGSRTDADVIERYWRWRVSTMSDRLAATLDLATVVASGDDLSGQASSTELLERIMASTA